MCVYPVERMDMGETNNVLNVFMSKPERVRSILEYYLKEKVPATWKWTDADGFCTVRNAKGKVSFRQRDILKRIVTPEGSFLLGIENQETINLIFPWRLLQMDSLIYEREIEEIQQQNVVSVVHYTEEDDLKYVLGLLKRAGSRKRCKDYINQHKEYFCHLPKSAADVLDVCMNIPNVKKHFVYKDGEMEEETDMCKAFDDWEKYAIKEGKVVP